MGLASVLPRLCEQLCDTALEISASWRILEFLYRSGLFIERLDELGRWYRLIASTHS
jgi:ATP/maltotriose-dependent transcriptional regulator MalT